jgi:hypothetical protein
MALLTGLFLLKDMKENKGSEVKERSFHVEHPEDVQLIFMTNRTGDKQIFLRKQEDGSWTVNDEHPASKKRVDFLLNETMANLAVQGPAPKAAIDNILSYMSINGIKVEVYTEDLDKADLTYTVGNTTPSQLGTYFKLPGDNTPMIVQIPGFDGFVNSRYSLELDDWISRRVFASTKEEITSVEVSYPDSSKNFRLNKTASGDIDFTSEITDVNNGAVKSYLNLFERLNFETYVYTTSDSLKDSLLLAIPFCTIRVESTNRGVDELKFYMKKAHEKMHGLYDKDGNALAHDPSRFYALYNKMDRVLIVQDYTFGKVLQTAGNFSLSQAE